MKHHLEKFFLFDLMFFGLVVILYHMNEINDTVLRSLYAVFESLILPYKTAIFSQSWSYQALGLYGIAFFLGRFLTSRIWVHLLILLLCCSAVNLVFDVFISFNIYSFVLLSVHLLLFFHWHQTNQSASLRLSYLCLGIIILNHGILSLGWMLCFYILYLIATQTSKRRIVGLIDPIGLMMLLTVLALWHQDVKSYATPYLASFFPALGLLLSFKIDRIWHHRWIRKYRQWISSGFALSLPTGALLTQPYLANLSTSPYWIWLSLSAYGVLRSFRFRQSFWPEVTTACQIIPLVFGCTQVMHKNEYLSSLQFLTENLFNQRIVSERHQRLLTGTHRLRPVKKMGYLNLNQRNHQETEIILQDLYSKD